MEVKERHIIGILAVIAIITIMFLMSAHSRIDDLYWKNHVVTERGENIFGDGWRWECVDSENVTTREWSEDPANAIVVMCNQNCTDDFEICWRRCMRESQEKLQELKETTPYTEWNETICMKEALVRDRTFTLYSTKEE